VTSSARAPALAFHQVPEGKTVKNRVHLDLITTDIDGESERVISLGATVVHTIVGQATKSCAP